MIEELTPQVLMSTMVLVIVVSPCLTLAISALLIWLYRRAVARSMAETAGFDTTAAATESSGQSPSGTSGSKIRAADARVADLYRRAMLAPRYNAAIHADIINCA
jgi:phosphate/sulfate permease